jgi:hypothetical protein
MRADAAAYLRNLCLPGRGLKIVNELTKALDGRFDQRFTNGGSTSVLVFPSSAGPHRKRKNPTRNVAGVRHAQRCEMFV